MRAPAPPTFSVHQERQAMAVTMQQVLAILNRDEPDYEMARALGPDALPLLQQLINGGDHMRASKATSAAGVIDGPAAVSVLEHAAKSQVAAVRVNAAAAVGHLAPTLGASVLVHLLSDHDLGLRRP